MRQTAADITMKVKPIKVFLISSCDTGDVLGVFKGKNKTDVRKKLYAKYGESYHSSRRPFDVKLIKEL